MNLRNPRLKDIAQRAGVSAQAVSAALGASNTTSDVSERTRRRVLKIAREMGYVPNAVASSLARGRASTIGLTCFGVVDQHLVRAIETAEHVCTHHHHALLFRSASREPGLPDWASMLRNRRVDYLLVISTTLLDWVGEDIPKSLQDRVAVIGPMARDHVPTNRRWGAQLVWDEADGAALAVKHLLDRGCRRIGVLAGASTRRKISTVIRLLEETDVDVRVARSTDESDFVAAGSHMTEQLVDAFGGDVDGLLLRHDQFYPGVADTLMRRLGERSRRVELVGFFALYSCLTSIRTPIREATAYALETYFASGPPAVEDRWFDMTLRTRKMYGVSAATEEPSPKSPMGGDQTA